MLGDAGVARHIASRSSVVLSHCVAGRLARALARIPPLSQSLSLAGPMGPDSNSFCDTRKLTVVKERCQVILDRHAQKRSLITKDN